MDGAASTDPDSRGRAVLYLSYDGMTDPLGQSQVLPYLTGLAERGHRITLVSCEKPGRTTAEVEAVRSACAAAGISWRPIRYHKRPPVLSSAYDLTAMRRLAERLHRLERFDWVHCRSYLPALVGLALKRRHGIRFLFDMRGFWADERVDGGLWNLRSPVFRAVYGYFKRREADFLREADHVVSLTEAGRQMLLGRSDRPADGPPISVIPCCVDFDSFAPANADRRAEVRETLGIAPDRRVAAYLGSIGTWYMLDEMLDYFAVQLERDPAALFLLVTRDDAGPILEAARARGIPRDALLIRGASRVEVPQFLAAADYGLFFIRPTFSKIASSPTKLGELLALGLPYIANGGVGDVARITEEVGGGVLVDRFDAAAYRNALDRLEALGPDGQSWRRRARLWFDLETGIERYDAIYRESATDRNNSTSRGAWEASE
jgi:glycosyltransferase involved in cell wall biosynthesis